VSWLLAPGGETEDLCGQERYRGERGDQGASSPYKRFAPQPCEKVGTVAEQTHRRPPSNLAFATAGPGGTTARAKDNIADPDCAHQKRRW
jgi:hypothetical protein